MDSSDSTGPPAGTANASAAAAKQLPPSTDHFLPGQASIYVKTWGCGHNHSDGEYMAGLLAAEGYRVLTASESRDGADVWLLNSCTVKNPSETTFGNEVSRGQALGKKVVVAGCVPQAAPRQGVWANLSVVGVQQLDRVVEIVEETLKGRVARYLGDQRLVDPVSGRKRKAGGTALSLPKVRQNNYIEIVPINTGCLNTCSYCKTKQARGDLGSYTPDEIVRRVNDVLDEGVREIWITSEDTGAYGRDLPLDPTTETQPSIVTLMDAITNAMDAHPTNRDAMLRLGMTNPPYILEHLAGMARIMRHARVYAFLHVPVQSGSDAVLARMKRQYTCAEFKQVVTVLREQGACVVSPQADEAVHDTNAAGNGTRRFADPTVTIATDVICGFPGETDEDHQASLQLLEQFRFPVLNISQFYKRPGTLAARMKPIVPSQVIKARSRDMTRLFYEYEPHGYLVGTVQRVLVTQTSTDGQYLVAHTKNYTQVLIAPHDLPPSGLVAISTAPPGSASFHLRAGDVALEQVTAATSPMMGRVLLVRITEAGKFFVRASVLRDLTDPRMPDVFAGDSVPRSAAKAAVAVAVATAGEFHVTRATPPSDASQASLERVDGARKRQSGGPPAPPSCAASSDRTTDPGTPVPQVPADGQRVGPYRALRPAVLLLAGVVSWTAARLMAEAAGVALAAPITPLILLHAVLLGLRMAFVALSCFGIAAWATL